MKRWIVSLTMVAGCAQLEPSEPIGLATEALLHDAGATVARTTPAATIKAQLDALRARRLTELSRRESVAVCEAADARQDLCAAAGRWQPDRLSCEHTVQNCRQQAPGPHISCELAHYDFGASCAATVDQYLSCIEDWNANLDCAAIGFMGWGTPDVRPGCLALLNACPQFIPEYGDPAYFVPHCDKATSPVRVDTDDDIRGIDVCRPVPTRMVVLGDSIASCLFSFDPDGSTICAPDLIADYLRAHYAPTLEYESHAYPGAVTADGLTQAEAVTPGPGHVLVWVYLGGNDIAPCVLPDMQQAMTCVDNVIASLTSEWKPIVDYFSDPARFPDGVTFMLNTQYGLKDECQNPGAAFLGTTPELDQKLQEYNQRLFIDPALARLDTVAVDQYPDWLGHGAFADNARCPHCYRDDNTRWLFFDGVHPNATGQRHIASKWEIAIDRIYGACKP